MTVDEFFREQNVEWTFDLENADLWIRKPELSKNTPAAVADEKMRIAKSLERPTLLLIAEPREHCPVTYAFADPRATLAVAPGLEFKMLYDRGEWVDPQLENWEKRLDRACFIGRPTPERIRFVKGLLDLGVEIDIFSQASWPLPQWRGPAADDVADARRYKFRFVYETTLTHLCHSEKLFLGIRSGCVTFYEADPQLDLHFCKDAFVKWSADAWKNRHELAPGILEGIHRFMFSSAWEIYSYREHYQRIINEARRVHQENPLGARLLKKRSLDSLVWRTNHDEPEGNQLFDRGLVLANQGRFVESFQIFEKVRELFSPGEWVPIISNRGLLQIQLKNYELADALFRLGLERDPEAPECLLNYGVSQMHQKKYAVAVEIFSKSYGLGYRSPLLCRNLGLSFAHLGKLEEAQKYLGEAFTLAPENLEIAADLASICLSSRRRDETQALIRHILKINPHHERAKKISDALSQAGGS